MPKDNLLNDYDNTDEETSDDLSNLDIEDIANQLMNTHLKDESEEYR